MNRHHNHSPHALDAQCTCHEAPAALAYDVGAGPAWDWDPDCPRHGLDAQLRLADPTLDIDERPREEAA